MMCIYIFFGGFVFVYFVLFNLVKSVAHSVKNV